MELLQLKYFCSIAEHGSVTAAARALYVSQPALSRSLATLEAELGIRLFDREGRTLHLNAAGTRRQIMSGFMCHDQQAQQQERQNHIHGINLSLQHQTAKRLVFSSSFAFARAKRSLSNTWSSVA